MKTFKLAVLFPLLLLLLNNCEKSSANNDGILQNEWRVQSIQMEKDFIKVPSDNNLGKNAYVLRFDDNTTFYMPTSVNEAGGKYQILSEGCIIVSDYHEFTEKSNTIENQEYFDRQLLSVFNGELSYSCTRNNLIFKSKQNAEVVFVKNRNINTD
ncbi:MAG: META domain-containing protein [Salinivirgaceae bacterium]|nr:META domain-containing protein [Salinivirgaceae bacterium]